jgi:hypothetical protein
MESVRGRVWLPVSDSGRIVVILLRPDARRR